MSKEKVLCTGSCGFLGHHLVRRLKDEGYEVIGVDNLSNGDEKYGKDASIFFVKNVGDLDEYDLEGVRWVFHTAALPRVPYSIEHPLETNEANVNETLKLLMLSKQVGVEKVIYSSSSSAYGGQDVFPTHEECRTVPLSPYAVQKLAAEHYCEVFRGVFNLPTVSLRYFNIFGEEQRADNPYTGVITKFLAMRDNGQPLTIFGDGEQRRDFTYVQDVVEANLLTAKTAEGVFNVGTGENTSVLEIARAISDFITHVPPRPGDPLLSLADNTKLKKLGWKPSVDVLSWLSSQ